MANSGLLGITYYNSKNMLQQHYLYDLALEYKYNFDPSGQYVSSNCSELLSELEKQRFSSQEG